MFMSTPNPAAMPVSAPRSNPAPTANSPNVMTKEKRPVACRTMCWRNHTYQPCTAGLGPEDLANAPLTNPVNAVPLAPQAGEVIFSQPASSQGAPTFMRTTNHTVDAPDEPRKKREIRGSGNSSPAPPRNGGRATAYLRNATMSATNNRTRSAGPQ